MERFDGKKKYYLNFKSEKRIEGNFQESKFKRLSLQNQILAANNTFFVNSTARHSMKPKQWPLAPNSPKWRITRANVSRRVTFFSKSPLANVSECIESGLSRVANLANLANF